MAQVPSTAAYFKAINDRDCGAFVGCFAAGCEAHHPFGSPPYRGESLPSLFDDMLRAWEKLELIPKSAYRSGARVAVVWKAYAVGQGGSAATQFDGVTVFEVNEAGKITRLESYWNTRAASKQKDEE